MEVYNNDKVEGNSNNQNAKRLARRLSREFGISVDHAIAVVAANYAVKEQGRSS